MHLGVVLPHGSIGADRAELDGFVRAVEDVGYQHLVTSDHVLGANPDAPDFDGHFDNTDPFHELFTTFGYVSAITDDVRLLSGILVLPQRQTAVVAKQAAQVDFLSDGRLDLGVAVGWNDVEYEALGMDFTNRGARIDEAIDVLRALWEDEVVEFDGRYHTIPDMGLNPRPVQRPIPLWIGGSADVVLRRAARKGDGWIAGGSWSEAESLDDLQGTIDDIHAYLREEGRDPEDFFVHGRVALAGEDPDEWVRRTAAWHDLGATHVAVDTHRVLGVTDNAEHARLLEAYHDAVAEAGLADPV